MRESFGRYNKKHVLTEKFDRLFTNEQLGVMISGCCYTGSAADAFEACYKTEAGNELRFLKCIHIAQNGGEYAIFIDEFALLYYVDIDKQHAYYGIQRYYTHVDIPGKIRLNVSVSRIHPEINCVHTAMRLENSYMMRVEVE